MFQPQNKIIIVDNRDEHLEILSKEFYDNGIGCKTFKYDAGYDAPLLGVRIVFFDINLNDLPSPESQKSQIYATLIDAINLYIHNDNGPFALIFWTSNQALIEDLKIYITEREIQLPTPFLVTHIDKDEFIDTGSSLVDKLKEILNQDSIQLLFDFEKKALDAAARTIDQIYKIIPSNDSWGFSENFNENFDRVFSKIAESTSGYKHAKENPTKAVYSALIPMLNYFINENVKSETWGDVLSSLRTSNNSNELIYPPDFDFRILNNVFHIESDLSSIRKGKRGAVMKYMIESPVEYSYTGSQYFAELEKKSVELFSQFIIFKGGTATPEQKDSFMSKSEFVLVEISAGCDYAQNKSRLNKYVLGLITPIIPQEMIFGKTESLFELPEISYNDVPSQIRLNFSYVFGLEPTDRMLGAPIFLLKGNIINMIGNRYASHISRIGITSFR